MRSKHMRLGTIPDWVLDDSVPIEVRRDAVTYWNSRRPLRHASAPRLAVFGIAFATMLSLGSAPGLSFALLFALVLWGLLGLAPIGSARGAQIHREISKRFHSHKYQFDGDTLKPSGWG